MEHSLYESSKYEVYRKSSRLSLFLDSSGPILRMGTSLKMAGLNCFPESKLKDVGSRSQGGGRERFVKHTLVINSY